MYLFLAFFWLSLAVILQYYWDTLERHAYIPVHRNVVSLLCFVVFSYNFVRWRMARVRQRTIEQAQPLPPRPRVIRAPDPTFDFSDPKPEDGHEKKPTA